MQAKFSLPAALSIIAIARKAGEREFSDAFVGSEAMQAMQRRIRTALDSETEAQGFDVMRSRITIRLTDSSAVAGWADERYRGGPDNLLSNAEVEAKVRSCCDGVLSEAGQDRLIETAWSITRLPDTAILAALLGPDR